MKVNTLATIKKELKHLDSEELLELCLKLSKYKKENKELLNYLLFEANDEEHYVREIKVLIEEEFATINHDSLHYVKKSLQRILRIITKHAKYSGKKTTLIELLIFFCQQVMEHQIPIDHHRIIYNMYERQVNNINKAMLTIHEDYHQDYEEEIDSITAYL